MARMSNYVQQFYVNVITHPWYNHIGILGHILHLCWYHDDVIKWKHFPRYWSFLRGTHRSPVNSPHKGQWRVAFMFSLICAWINAWVNNRESGVLRRHRTHYDVTVMCITRTSDGIIINGTLTTILVKAASPILFLFCFAFCFVFAIRDNQYLAT